MDAQKTVRTTTQELLAKLEIVATTQVDELDGAYQVHIDPADPADVPLLIGYHGETIASFQIILGLLVYKQLNHWTKVVVDVSDYREKRAVQLRAMAESFIAQALSSGQTIYLPPLSPAERRVVHLVVSEREDVESFSEGEGSNRRLAIRPK